MEIGDASQTAAGRSTIARDALIGLGIAAALVVAAVVVLQARYGSVGNGLAAWRGEAFAVSAHAAPAAGDGDVVVTEYLVRNLTGEPARVVTSRSSCDCAMVGALPAVIDPRETASVSVSRSASRSSATAEIVLVVNAAGQVHEVPLVSEGS